MQREIRREMAEPNRTLPRGSLYIWQDGVLFVGSDMVNELHRHFTASVSIALTGSFRVQTGRGVEPKAYRGLMVAPNTEQNMDARGSRVLILQVDPESRDYARIVARFERHGPIHANERRALPRFAQRNGTPLGTSRLFPDRSLELGDRSACGDRRTRATGRPSDRRGACGHQERLPQAPTAEGCSLTEAAHRAGFADSPT
jgi:hypothetical protein